MTHSFTGHRPDKLGGYSDEATKKLVEFAKTILQKYDVKESTTGMALGWDMAVAIASYRLGISFHAAIPFKGQENRWSDEWKKYYNFLLGKASSVIVVSEDGYVEYKKRNEYMVNKNPNLIALWNGSSGGTGNTVKYAKELNKNIINVWNDWSKYGNV